MSGGDHSQSVRGNNNTICVGGHDEEKVGAQLFAEATVAEGGTGGLLQRLRGGSNNQIYLFYDLDARVPDNERSLWSQLGRLNNTIFKYLLFKIKEPLNSAK